MSAHDDVKRDTSVRSWWLRMNLKMRRLQVLGWERNSTLYILQISWSVLGHQFKVSDRNTVLSKLTQTTFDLKVIEARLRRLLAIASAHRYNHTLMAAGGCIHAVRIILCPGSYKKIENLAPMLSHCARQEVSFMWINQKWAHHYFTFVCSYKQSTAQRSSGGRYLLSRNHRDWHGSRSCCESSCIWRR